VLNATFKMMFEDAPSDSDLAALDVEPFLAKIDAVFADTLDDTVDRVRDLFVREIERLFALIRTQLRRWVGTHITKTRITVMREAYKLISLASHMRDDIGSTPTTAASNLQTQYTDAVEGLRVAVKTLEDAERLERADAEVRRLAAMRDLSLQTQRSESRLDPMFVLPSGCGVLTSTIASDEIDGLLSGMAKHATVELPTRALLDGVLAILPDLEMGSLVRPHKSCHGKMQL
jgi:hypothetical protein